MRSTVIIALVAGSVAVAAGCGSGGSKSTTTMSPAQFRQRASQICTNSQQQLNKIKGPTSAKDLPSYLNKVQNVGSGFVNKLSALNPPAQLAGQFNQALSLSRQELNVVNQSIKNLQNGKSANQVARNIQQTASRISQQENAKWKKLGIPKCAS